jgi:hypothetical protein
LSSINDNNPQQSAIYSFIRHTPSLLSLKGNKPFTVPFNAQNRVDACSPDEVRNPPKWAIPWVPA